MMWLWAALSSSAVLLLARTAAASASSSPAPWPDAFSVEFLTNATTNSSDRSTCVRNTLHYDWGLKMQAVVHGPGAIECAHFYNTSSACTLVFTAESMYRVLAEPRAGQKRCCKDTGSPFGMTPPTWASGSNATFEGFVQDPFSGMLAKKFAWPQLAGPMGMHTYLETTVGQRQPLAFTFPAHNGLQDYHFLTDTQTNTRPDAGVFALPGECADEVC